MLTLTIDTSGEQYGLALAHNGGEILAQTTGTAGRTLDAVLFGAMRALFVEAGAELTAVGAIVACTGPGSFVGTRIGLAAANTIGMARQIPVLGVDVLQVLATLTDGGEVVAAVNCVRDEIIFQAFGGGDVPQALHGATLKSAAEFARAAGCRTVVLRPSTLGRASHAEAFPGVARVILADYAALLPAMARLGAAILRSDGLPPLSQLPGPLYVQPEDARA